MSKPAGLAVADGLALPLSVVAHRMAFLGTTNSGKTYGATKVAELMWDAGLQFCALDSMGLWWGLRSNADGSPGLSITIFGGKHGDIPIGPGDGALVADVIHQEGISAVIDISEFEHDSEKARFAHRFAERLYWLRKNRPGAIHVFLEEAHEFIPQNPQQGENDMLHVFNRMWKQGGNFGIGGSIISQRPQDVAKKALNLSAVVLAFNITGSQEYDQMAKWLKGVPELARLPELQPGECFVYSPSLLQFRGFVRINPKRTFHPRFDPLAADTSCDTATKTLARVDIEALRSRFAEQIEQAKADDPKQLKARIAELEKLLEDKGGGVYSEQQFNIAVETACRPLQSQLETAEAIIREAVPIAELQTDVARQMTEYNERMRAASERLQNVLQDERTIGEFVRQRHVQVGIRDAEPIERTIRRSEAQSQPSAAASDLQVSKAQLRILNALAQLELLGIPIVQKPVLAVYAGVSPRSGDYSTNLSQLRAAGLVAYPAGNSVSLTEAGRTMAGPVDQATDLKGYHASWVSMVSKAQALIIDRLISIYPDDISKDDLAIRLGVSPRSGDYGTNLGRLRALGAITYPAPGRVAATNLLFPEGLK